VDESMRAAPGAGTTVLYDGLWWEVAELAPPSVLLAAAGTLRRVSVSHLLAAEGIRLGEGERAPAWEGTLRLAGLDDTELAGLRERVAQVREACTGYRHGNPELAQQGEPRPEYAPGTSKLQRYRAKAAELGLGVRAVRR
jgi:hypothetical protein